MKDEDVRCSFSLIKFNATNAQYLLNILYWSPLTAILLLSHLPDDEGRPKLNLKPRTIAEPINSLAETSQSAAIFGNARPRDEKVTAEADESK